MGERTIKTQPKAQSYIIKRPRLTKLLDESGARIILLCAPAGYGKTTLAREWTDEQAERVAWYSAGPSICDVAAFACDLAELFASVSNVPAGEVLQDVRGLAARGEPGHLLARALAASPPPDDSLLVIDDYHHAAESLEADSLLRELTRITRFRLVLTSRTRPAWVTSRMLVYGEAIVLGATALAFTDDEAREVLADRNVAGHPNAVLEGAQGWPVVIGLAARQGGRGNLDALAPDALYEFFAEDLFKNAPLQLQSGLLILAAGGDADLEIARDLLGDSYEDLLTQASERGFISRGGHAEIVMHPLLRRFLVARLRDLERTRVESLVELVVARQAQSRRWGDCLATLELLPRADLIAETMRSSLAELLASGRIATVTRWLALARSRDLADPIFMLAEAEVAFREGEREHAQALAEQAAALFQGGDWAARAHLLAARAAHLREDADGAAANADRAHVLAVDRQTRLEALWLAFVDALEQQAPEADSLYDALLGLQTADPDYGLRLASARGNHEFESGNIRKALDTCERSAPLLSQIRDPVQRTGFLNLFAHVVIACAQYDRGLEIVGRQIDEARAAGLEFAVDYALLSRSSALIGLRKLLPAQRTLEDLQRRASSTSANIAVNITLCSARLRIAAGDLAKAAVLLQADPPASLPRALRGEFAAYRGLVHACMGRTNEAEDAFAGALAQSRYIDAAAVTALGRTIVVLHAAKEDATVAAIETVRRVLEQGHADAVITACRAYPPLAKACATDGRLGQVLSKLFFDSRDVSLGRQAGLDMPRELRAAEPLSRREYEVYELIIQGRTNREIASTLFISESTAKVHVRHIFEKLGVHTRAEAAAANVDSPLQN
jgi:LuxR family maltose regulon positive regulatory protein